MIASERSIPGESESAEIEYPTITNEAFRLLLAQGTFFLLTPPKPWRL